MAGLLSISAATAVDAPATTDGPAPAPTAPVPPLLPLAHAPYPLPPGPREMFSESTGRYKEYTGTQLVLVSNGPFEANLFFKEFDFSKSSKPVKSESKSKTLHI